MSEMNYIQLFESFFLAFIVYLPSVAFYRLYLSPLRKFPGPKLAAITRYYEGYYDLWLDGQWAFKLQELHREYGPIIRIAPSEVHINDPEFYDRLYLQRLDKDKWFISGFNGHSTFVTGPHELHRLRRSAINPFFSKGSISSCFPVVQEKVKRLCERFDELKGTGKVLQTKIAFIALTNDIISLFAFGHSWEVLEEPNLGDYWNELFATGVRLPPVQRMFPAVRLLVLLPPRLVMWMNPTVKAGIQAFTGLRKQIERRLKEYHSIKNSASPLQNDRKAKETIFDQILSAGLPPEELTLSRLGSEASILVGAGSETTAKALDVLAFHILDQPSILEKLRAELQHAHVSYSSTLSQLESIPYLTAVVKEGLRCANGITTRSPRVIRETLAYKNWNIPPHTVVSMTVSDVLTNETIFPEPDRFDPERWLLSDSSEAKKLDQYLVVFNRGPRQCVGMELAKAELYACTAALVAQFDLELFDTVFERDVKAKRDHFIPKPGPDSRGIRIKVRKRLIEW